MIKENRFLDSFFKNYQSFLEFNKANCIILNFLLAISCSSSQEVSSTRNRVPNSFGLDSKTHSSKEAVDVPEILTLLNIQEKDSPEYLEAAYKAAIASLNLGKKFRETGKTKASIRLLYTATTLMPWRDDLRQSYKISISQYTEIYLRKKLACSDFSRDLEFIQMYVPDLIMIPQIKECHFEPTKKKFSFEDYLKIAIKAKPEIDIVDFTESNLAAQLEEEIFHSEHYRPLRDYLNIAYLRAIALIGEGVVVCNKFNLVPASKKGDFVSLDAECINKFSYNQKSFREGGVLLKQILHWKNGTSFYPYEIIPPHQPRPVSENRKTFILQSEGWILDPFQISGLIQDMISSVNYVNQTGTATIVPIELFINNELQETVNYYFNITGVADSRVNCNEVKSWGPGYGWLKRCQETLRYEFTALTPPTKGYSSLFFYRDNKSFTTRLSGIHVSKLRDLKTISFKVNKEMMYSFLMETNGVDIKKLGED